MLRRLLFSLLVAIAVVALCVLAASFETGPGIQAAPAATTSGNGCISYWFVSYSGTLGYSLLNIDPDGLPLGDLRFGRTYNDPTDLSRGYLDFNRDGKSDVFSAVPLGDGTYRWRYSSGGTSASGRTEGPRRRQVASAAHRAVVGGRTYFAHRLRKSVEPRAGASGGA